MHRYFLLKYTILNNTGNNDDGGDDGVVRSIYMNVLYHSNYGKSSLGKTGEELIAMKSFFDLCLQFEMTNRDTTKTNTYSSNSNMAKRKKVKDRKEKKKAWKMAICKLYETAIGFYESGGGGADDSFWRNVVDGYQRDLQGVKYSL